MRIEPDDPMALSIGAPRAPHPVATGIMMLRPGALPPTTAQPRQQLDSLVADARSGTGLGPPVTPPVGVLQMPQREVRLMPNPVAGAPGVPAARSRWSVQAWSLFRQGNGTRALAPAAQYGASQAGLLIQYALPDAGHRPMLYARATSALAQGDDRTLAIGLAARPLPALPIDLALERRFALVEGQRDRVAVMALAGGAVPLGHSGARLEGYGQAGLVGLSDPLAFFDLQLVASQPVHRADSMAVALGGGLWAGGQQNADAQGGKPWVHRVDIGPRAALTVPVENGSLALALDWRQRIDGAARPSSGAAFTLSAGF